MSKLTTERLEKKIKSCIEIENCEVMMPLSAAQELLAFRNAAPVLPKQPVIPEGLIKVINRLLDNDGSRGCFDALEQHRAKTELEILPAAAQQNEPQNIPENIPTAHGAYISFDALMAAVSEVTGAKSEFDATPEKCYQAVPFMNFNSLSRIVEMFRTAQPVSEPYKLPELNDELIEILGRPNFTCTKLAECLRHCGQDIKRKSEYEQAAVLHVLLNLYIKHGNDWRKYVEEAFTPAVAQESE